MYSSNDNKKTNEMASERLNKLHDHLVNAQNGQCSFHREFERHSLGLEAIENAFAGRVNNSFALHRAGTLRAMMMVVLQLFSLYEYTAFVLLATLTETLTPTPALPLAWAAYS